MLKEIKFTSFEDQGKSLNDYSRSLTPQQRWDLLITLNKHAFWKELANPTSEKREIVVFVKEENESLVDLFARARTGKNTKPNFNLTDLKKAKRIK